MLLDVNIHLCMYVLTEAVFHEGMKGWGCCSKRVISFDEFLEIPGCTVGKHTDYVEVKEEKPVEKDLKMSVTSKVGGVEVYSSGGPSMFAQSAAPVKPFVPVKKDEPLVAVEENDPEDAVVEVGAVCKRNGCGYAFKSVEVSRGTGEEASCQYHPGTPVFHEVCTISIKRERRAQKVGRAAQGRFWNLMSSSRSGDAKLRNTCSLGHLNLQKKSTQNAVMTGIRYN